MTTFRDEKGATAANHGMAERHRFGRGGRFVEQRSIRYVERGEVGDHRLEIEERFQPSLRDFRLVRRVIGLPAGIFQDVALDHGRNEAVGITGADIVADNFVLLRDLAQLGERFLFRFPGRQIERFR